MNVVYNTNKLEKQLSNGTEIKKAFGNMAAKIGQRLDEMKSSPNLKVLMQIPAAMCHPLQNNRAGQWAVSISGNYRLVFRLDHNPVPMIGNNIDTVKVTDICILETTDYH